MVQAIVDPEDVDAFAFVLEDFTEDLANRLSTLKSYFDKLGDTWRDREHANFAKHFEETSRVLDSFMEAANDHVPFLRHKAELAREYLNHRHR